MLNGDLIWDDANEEHIARHRIIPEEVEEVCRGRCWLMKARDGRIAIYGQTEAGRPLMVVLEAESRIGFYVVTARRMDPAEQRRYQRWLGRRRR